MKLTRWYWYVYGYSRNHRRRPQQLLHRSHCCVVAHVKDDSLQYSRARWRRKVHRSWFKLLVLDFVGWAVVLTTLLLKFVQIHPYYRCGTRAFE
jgi:hypothetical protein